MAAQLFGLSILLQKMLFQRDVMTTTKMPVRVVRQWAV